MLKKWMAWSMSGLVYMLLMLAAAGTTLCPRAVLGAGACTRLAEGAVTWVVPHSVGGGYDTYSRLIAPFLEKKLGRQIVVQNRSGAGGTIGARLIHEAVPDGSTIGILNGAGLFIKTLAGGEHTPNPATDFTILARVARSQQIWAAAQGSSLRTMEDVLTEARERPVFFGMRDVGSTSFVNVAVTSDLLGIPVHIVAGYKGSHDKGLAAVRGEVDLVAGSFETLLPQIENGDLRPLLQVADTFIATHPSLDDVPLLGGPQGLAVQRAKELGRDMRQAREDATALAALLGAGRLIVGPPGLEPGLADCLEKSLLDVLSSPALQKAAAEAQRSLDIAAGSTAQAELQAAGRSTVRFLPIVQQAITRVRE